MKTRKQKAVMLERLRGVAQEAKMVVLFDFSGITAPQMSDLRLSLKRKGYTIVVVKNNLMRIAFEEKVPQISDVLRGPTAIAISYDDEVEPVKLLDEFFKENEKGAFKAAILNGELLDKRSVEGLAKLPSMNELRGKVVGAVAGPLYGLQGVLTGVLRGLVYALNALKEKKEKEG